MDVDQIFAIQRAKERKLSAARRWVALGGGGGETMYESLSALGMTGNLRLCLDAADFQSWPGSGQKWLDRSGGGYDFFRGTDATSQTSDPTFVGSYGGLSASEYWSFDGGDYFTYDSSNETWMNALHKDNAAFTVLCWLTRSGTQDSGIFGTGGAATGSIGTSVYVSNGILTLAVGNASGSFAKGVTATGVTDNAWSFCAVSLNEATGSAFFNVNGTASTFAGAYTSPSVSDASFTMQVSACGNAAKPMKNTGKKAMLAILDTALSQAQVDAVFRRTRDSRRFVM